jgi:hypothetical protein
MLIVIHHPLQRLNSPNKSHPHHEDRLFITRPISTEFQRVLNKLGDFHIYACTPIPEREIIHVWTTVITSTLLII